MTRKPGRMMATVGRVAANILAVGLIALAAHSWPVREYVRTLVAVRAGRLMGADVSIGELKYKLSTLAFEADNVVVSSRHADVDGQLFVPRVAVHLSWPALLAGRLEPNQLHVTNLEASASARGNEASITLRGLALSMAHRTPGGLEGPFDLHATSWVQLGPGPRDLDLNGLLRYDGGALHLNNVRVAVDGFAVSINGEIADVLGAAPRASLSGTWSASASDLCAIGLRQATLCDRIHDGTLRGLLRLDGTLASPELHIEVTGDGRLTGTSRRIAIEGEASVSSRAINIWRLDVSALGGRAVLTATVPLDEQTQRSSGTVRWEAIDLGALFEVVRFRAPPTATLSGHAVLMGDVRTPSSVSADVSTSLVTARGAALPVVGSATARLRDGKWVLRIGPVRLGATSLDGVASGDAGAGNFTSWRATALDGALRVETTDAREMFNALQAFGLVAPIPKQSRQWQVRANAELALSGTLTHPRLSGPMEADAWRQGDASATVARAVVRVDRDGIQVSDLSADRAADRLEGSFSYAARSGAVDGEFTATLPDLGELQAVLGVGWQLTGRARATGQISGSVSRPRLHAGLHASDVTIERPPPEGSFDPLRIDLGTVELLATTSDVIEVSIDLPDRQMTGSGAVDLRRDQAFNLSIALRETDVERIIAVASTESREPTRVDAEVSLRGYLQRPDDVEMDVRVSRLDASVYGARVGLPKPARLRVESSRIAEAEVAAQIGELSVRASRKHAHEPLEVQIEGQLPRAFAWRDEAPVLTINAVLDEQVVAIRRASGRWRDAAAEATAELPWSFVENWLPAFLRDAREESESAATARLEVRSIPLSEVTQQLLPPGTTPIDGRFDVVLVATAERASIDAVRVDGHLEGGRFELAGLRAEQQGSATLAMRGGIVSLTDSRWTAPGTDFTLQAESPVDAASSHFAVTVAGDVDLPAAAAQANDRLAGTARINMTVNGAPNGVSWNGSVQIRDGAWVTETQGIALTDVETTLACTDARCHIDAFSGRLNGGTLTMSGDVPMPGTSSPATLEAVLRGAGFELPRGTRHDVDADLALAGGEKPRLSGRVTVWPGTVSESMVGLSQLVSALHAESETAPRSDLMTQALAAVAVDIQITSGDDLVLDSPDVEVAATADLRVRGTLDSPRLHGEVAALERGRLFLAGREWRLEEGTVSLVEAGQGTNVRLSATLTARISKYTVTIRLSGPANRPTLVMSADPPLGQSDVAELVLTGTTSGSMGRSGTQRVATVLSTDLLTGVGRAVGVDAVRIEQSQSDLSVADLEPVSRLTVSKRLTEKFEIVYSQGLDEEDDLAWVLVWKPGWYALDLRATIRTSDPEAYEVRQEFEFGSPRRFARAAPSRPAAPPVSHLEVIGLPPEETEEVRALLSLRTGHAFTAAAWQRDRQAVIKHFHDRDRLHVRVRSSHTLAPDGGYSLSYRITAGPVTRLEVRGHDIDETTRTALRDAWSHAASEALIEGALNDVMSVRLAAHGYLAAEVTTTLTRPDADGLLATIEVVRGARATRRSIAIAGNHSIQTDNLRRAMAARRVEPRCWLDPSLVEEPLRALYRTRGFLAAHVAASRDVEDDRATLNVRIEEGPQFTVGTVTVPDAIALGDEVARSSFGLAAGAPFSDAALSTAAASLGVAYARAGHLAAEITPDAVVRFDRQVVDITVHVNEGPASVLRAIRVVGGEGTSPHLVSRALAVPTGRPIDRVALDQAQQRLYQTGIFRRVDIDVEPATAAADTAPVSVDAVVTLEERAKYRVRYGFQFGPTTLESVTPENTAAMPGATFDIQRRNLYGVGLVIGGGGVWSGGQHRVRATASASTFRGRFVSTTLTVEHANQDRQSDEYAIQIVDRSLRAVLEQRWRLGRDRRTELAYGFDIDHRRLELTATTEAPLPLRARFAGLHTTFTYDARDNLFNPRRGMFHASRIEAGAGLWLSDIAFVRYQFQQFFYRPAGPVTLASGVRFGTLHVDEARQPASLLLFFTTGGGNTVRGYDDDDLTPAYVLGVPAGGKALLVLNQEVRVPIWRKLGGVGFVDAGNTFKDLGALDLGALKVGIGAGLRVETPVAVLRLDFGFPVPRPAGEPRARWYLSIGHAF